MEAEAVSSESSEEKERVGGERWSDVLLLMDLVLHQQLNEPSAVTALTHTNQYRLLTHQPTVSCTLSHLLWGQVLFLDRLSH